MIDTHHSASFSHHGGSKKTFHDICGRIDVTMTLSNHEDILPRYGCTVSSGFFKPAGPTCKQIHQMIGFHMNFWNGLAQKIKTWRKLHEENRVQLVSVWDHSKTTHQLFFQSVLCFSQWWAHLASHIHTWSNVSFSSWIPPDFFSSLILRSSTQLISISQLSIGQIQDQPVACSRFSGKTGEVGDGRSVGTNSSGEDGACHGAKP